MTKSEDLIKKYKENSEYTHGFVTDIETIEVDNKILQAGHHHGSTYYEHLKFLDCIKNKSNPEVSLNDGLIAVATGEAAEKSIKENRVVKMSEFNL